MIILGLVISGVALLFLLILLVSIISCSCFPGNADACFAFERRDPEEPLFVLPIIYLTSFSFFSLDEIIYGCYYYSITSLARLFGFCIDSLETIFLPWVFFSLILGDDFY